MKVEKALIIRTAELGIIRSMESFLEEPLKPGRLKTRFEFVKMIIDRELRIIRDNTPLFFVDNRTEIEVYLNTLSDAIHWVGGETHIGAVVSFCLEFLKRSVSIYDPKLEQYLNEILDYYERVNESTYRELYAGKEMDKNWKIISEMMNDGSNA